MRDWKRKLEPLRMLTLAETRTILRYRLRVYAPQDDKKACWAVVDSEFGGEDIGCQNNRRKGYLTCLVHHTRELAARGLKCETDGVTMGDIAYADEADQEADKQAHLEEYRVAMAARIAELERLLQEG
jgi:hypothetical protein